MNIHYAGCSRTGLVRSNNEDAILMLSNGADGLFLVADGIGGREDGEVVSGLLRDRFRSWWQDTYLPKAAEMSFGDIIAALKNELLAVNRDVILEYGPMKAGSTLTLLFVHEDKCIWISVGDSRLYRIDGLSIKQLTLDDIYDNLIDRRIDHNNSNNKGRLASAVGIWEDLEYSIGTAVLKSGSSFFLCSDGVYKYISAGRLGRCICTYRMMGRENDLINKLSRITEKNGARDNYSMIYVWT